MTLAYTLAFAAPVIYLAVFVWELKQLLEKERERDVFET